MIFKLKLLLLKGINKALKREIPVLTTNYHTQKILRKVDICICLSRKLEKTLLQIIICERI